jgi:hypothetical protein
VNDRLSEQITTLPSLNKAQLLAIWAENFSNGPPPNLRKELMVPVLASLVDFAKIVEQFDKQGISFVSVTQEFNTTTSMGRLPLTVLLSFAQFEREVTLVPSNFF